MAQEPVQVSTLLGHSHMDMALTCLGSLQRFSAEPLAFRIHDDGTLTAEDLDRLAAGLREPTVLRRAEADERMADLLAGRPAARAFRRENLFGLKLLDTVLLATGGRLAYCDTDILFLRPFSGLFRFPSPGVGAVFMRDPQNAYSVRSWHLLRHPRLRLAARVNAGFVHYRVALFDPDLVEWTLGRPELRRSPVWIEQTCWSLLGWQAGCHLLDPAQVDFPWPGMPAREELVALHFVNPVRSLLPLYTARLAQGEPPGPPVVVASRPARRCRAGHLLATELARRVRRAVGRSPRGG